MIYDYMIIFRRVVNAILLMAGLHFGVFFFLFFKFISSQGPFLCRDDEAYQ